MATFREADLSSLNPAVRRAFLDAQIKKNLALFVRMAFETVVPGETLHLNWHLLAIAHVLDQVMKGNIKRLIITIPPRSTKSITASVAFPAFVLGHDPTKKIIGISYSADLATKHHNDFRAVMESPIYRRVFPNTRISSSKNTEQECLTTMRGGRYSTSVGGTLTGRGGNLIIIDDPMNPQQALSESERNKANNYFRNTVLSRLNSKTEDAIVIIMQRLHMDDLVGSLLAEGGWKHLNIPAIAETNQRIAIGDGLYPHRRKGSVIDPTREPLKVLESLRRDMGELHFSAQFQQRPIPLKGNIIKREWFRYYDTRPTDPGQTVISWDTAMKPDGSSDYTVGTVWHARGEICHLLDLIRGRYNFPKLKEVVMRTRAIWPNSQTVIEDKGSGTSLIQDLRSSGVGVVPKVPKGEKAERLAAASIMFECGSVYFPKSAPWLSELEAELLGFPGTRHDDQVDSISQALLHIKNRDGYVCAPAIICTPSAPSLRDQLNGAYGRKPLNSDPVFIKPWQRGTSWDNNG